MDRLETLLDSYYGMQDEEAAVRDAHDIDSGSFNVSAYASDVLRSKSLPELMAYSNTLINDTRSLDKDMQDLVYNNYNKFISATDTIRRMRDSVGEMETAMTRLVKDMRAMGGSSALVNDNLQENRGKIEKLVGVKRLIIKLEFLFELPMRLRRAMELDALAQAVRYYTMVSGVLRKYDGIPSIHAIRVEADAIMDRLKEQLRGVLRTKASASAAPKVVEAIRLLVQLEEPRPGLRAAYLTFQKARLLQSLQQYAERYVPAGGYPAAPGTAASASAAASAFSFEETAGTGADLLSTRAQAFYAVAAAAKAANATAPSTLASPRPRATLSALEFVQGANASFLEGFRYAADVYVELFEEGISGGSGDVEAERRGSHEELVSFTKDVFAAYFSTLRKQLSLPPPLPGAAAAADAEAAKAGKKGKKAAKLEKSKSNSRLSEAGAGGGEDAEEEAEKAAAAAAEAEAHAAGRFANVTDALKVLLTDIRSASKNVREARLHDRAHEVAEAVLRAQLDGLFADVRGDVVHTLLRLQKHAAEAYDQQRQRAQAAASGHAGEKSSEGAAPAPAPAAAPTAAAIVNPFAGEHSGAGASSRQKLDDDWLVALGSLLSAAADKASSDISQRIDDALLEAKPLVLAGVKLLPDMARTLTSLVHGQVLNVLSWLSAALEACGDGAHPCRIEYHQVVVEADLGLEKDAEAQAGSGGGKKSSSRKAGPAQSAAVKRRVTVNFASAEGDQTQSVGLPSVASSSILSPDGDKHHSFLLLLAVLCRHFAHNGVARALSTMIHTLPTRTDLQALGVPVADSEADSYGSMMDVPDLIKRIQAAGKELLRRFVYLHGARLSGMIRRAQTAGDWLAHREPRDVRLMIPLLLEDCAGLKKQVAAALGDWDVSAATAIAKHVGLGTAVTPASGSSAAASAAAASAGGNPFAVPAAPGLRTVSTSSGNPSTLASAAAAKRTGFIVGASGLGGTGAGGLGLGAQGLGIGASGLSGLPGSAATRGMPMDMDRLFRSGSDGSAVRIVLGAVDYSADSAMRVLLRVVLKALVEWTRQATFSQGGYQQMQVDLAALHIALPYFTTSTPPPAQVPATSAAPGAPLALPGAPGAGSGSSGSGASYDPYQGAGQLEELLHEAAVSAGERSVEQAAMEPAVLYNIATSKLATVDVVHA